ncbi:MAG: chloride channel protein [Eubacteriales bacterium]
MKVIKEQTIKNKNKKVESMLLIDGIIVGIIAGFAGVLYRILIDYGGKATDIFVKKINEDYAYGLPLMIWLLVLGFFSSQIISKDKYVGGSGIPQVAAEVTGRIDTNPFKVLVLKLIGGMVSALGGLSLGREGPSIQLGAMSGKIVAKLLKRTKIRENYLMTSGASAGLAVAFHAPLAGVLFSMEEIHKNVSKKLIISCFSAAVVADLISQFVFGFKPVFPFPAIWEVPIKTYPFIVILGIALGLAGTLYNKVMKFLFDFYNRCHLPIKIRPFIAYLTAGFMFFAYPQVLGSGHNLVEMVLYSKCTIAGLAILFIIKFIFSLISFTSGVPGGIFLPILVQGAILGSLFGMIAGEENMEIYVIIAMAGYLTAVVRNPLTSIVLIFEMTGSLNGFLPLAMTCLFAYFTANLLGTKPVYEYLLDRVLETEKENKEQDVEVEIVVSIEAGSSAVGMKIKDIEWLRGSIIVQIERGGRWMLPKGDTIIEQNDKLTLHLPSKNVNEMIRHLSEY